VANGSAYRALARLSVRLAARGRKLRRQIYEVIEIGRGDDQTSRLFDAFIIGLITLNIAAFVAETMPDLASAYAPWFRAFEVFSVTIFTIEYGLRIWTAVEMPFLARMRPWRARLHLATRGYLIIDLLAILPFYLGGLLGLDLRVLRVLRLLRFFKLSRYSPAMHTLLRVLHNERRSLMGAGLLLTAALLLSATGMYYIEGSTQPDKFGSVPQAAYWAMTTLTTVGYGDVAPVTPLGKLWSMMTMLCGLCVLALPVAIISSGFAQEVGRRDFVVTWSLMSRIPLLAELDARAVAKVMPLLHAHNLPPNVEVIGEGEPCKAMYFVAAGQVRLKSPGQDHTFLTGDFFGVMPMLDGKATEGAFVTASRCRLLKLFREDFHRLETTNPEIAAHIRTTAARRRAMRISGATHVDRTQGQGSREV
jgi:voltage-gated potassium channel